MRDNYFELLKEGHTSALEKIYMRYSRQIFWLGKGLINDDFVIESLVQDAFLKLWVHRDTIETPEHIFFFLRFVMKRECISYYCRPKNKFSREFHSLERYDNYRDYMAGYDPLKEAENRQEQEQEQRDFDTVQKVLPLLDPQKRHLIELCLKYGFQYKAISKAMGTSVTQTSNDVKVAIHNIKSFIHQETQPENIKKPGVTLNVQGAMTKEQVMVLKLRCEKKYSFASIAAELNLSQKEVHKEFMAAYKIMQEKHEQQLKSA